MKANYHDITDVIKEPAQWYDEHGVPRFCEFHAQRTANIYASEAALIEVTCQGCGRAFHVAVSADRLGFDPERVSLADQIRARSVHYGDPPNVFCCPAGPTMNAVPMRVLQYWRRGSETNYDWLRDDSLAGATLLPAWAQEDVA